jgi:hypothetical protein
MSGNRCGCTPTTPSGSWPARNGWRAGPSSARTTSGCDGSGYHRGCTRHELSLPARVLAAADAYQAMTQRRAHRPALRPSRPSSMLLEDVRAGRLDADAEPRC